MFGIFKIVVKLDTILSNQADIIANQFVLKDVLGKISDQQEALLKGIGELQGHIHTHPLRVRASTKAALEQHETGTAAEELTISDE